MESYNPTQTPADITLDTASAVLSIRYTGKVSAQGLARVHDAVLDTVAGRTVVGLVIDVSRSEAAYGPGDLLENMENCVADMALERVAVITQRDRAQLIMLMETVAFPHGVRVRATSDRHEAWRFASGV